MRYTRLRVWFLLLAVTVGVIFVLHYAASDPGLYRSSNPITDSLITNTYPDLYTDIFERDAGLLKPYLSHESQQIRDQAWRALANTPVDSMDEFIKLAVDQNAESAWFAISQHEYTAPQLRMLEELWEENPDYRAGISRVLGQQGDEQSLDFLLDKINEDWLADEYQLALAISRLITRYEVDESDQIAILQRAFDLSDEKNMRAYLYGWYRGARTPLTATSKDTLFGRWQTIGAGTRSTVDQIVARLVGDRTVYRLAIYYNGEDLLKSEIQLSIELARSIAGLQVNDQHALASKILLSHENPNVQAVMLESLTGKLSDGDNLTRYIRNEMVPDSTLDHSVWLRAIKAVAQIDSAFVTTYEGRLQQIVDENQYLMSEVLSVYEKNETPLQFINRIGELISRGDPLLAMQSMQKLISYWRNLNKETITESLAEAVRKIGFQALEMGDRGVTYSTSSLLEAPNLYSSEDFERINQTLTAFSLPEDIEVYQAFGSLYKQRFEQQARSVIDSLASFEHAPLNRSLADAGWDVNVPEKPSHSFRTPDWERLWELGRHPVLRLRTERGDVRIRMNTLSAPATVAAIDSLSRSGAYDGVPFHRVVPNFVIQGGDIERADGMGGPDFIIPTEASEVEFNRGAAGIASAGPDTEGSQYFIMHQWKPHLNGNYTRFGEVVEGLNVVDRITVGDKVLYATWF